MKRVKTAAQAAYLLRRWVLEATGRAGSGHVTSSLSAADLIAVLFTQVMRYDPTDHAAITNDRCIFSKGHAAPLLYAAWHLMGELSYEELLTLRQWNSRLTGHPTPQLPFVDAATGSLGQGLAIALGNAWVYRYRGSAARQYVLMGDAELDEGSVWEAAACIIRQGLAKITAIVDANGFGQTTSTIAHQSMDMDILAARWAGFGWHVLVIDGHSIAEIEQAYSAAEQEDSRPTVIIARTVKGYGLPAVAGHNEFHAKVFGGEARQALDCAFPHEASARELQAVTYTFCVPRDRVSQVRSSESYVGSMLPIRTVPVAPFGLNHSRSMRGAVGQEVVAAAREDSTLLFVDADVSNSAGLDTFVHEYPERVVFCGVAEQTLVGIGVGLSARGYNPVLASFASFFTRAADQLRLAAIGGARLQLVGCHAGVSTGEDGPSQMGLEDFALMRALPGAIVLSPADVVSARCLMRLSLKADGIRYIRIPRPDQEPVYIGKHSCTIGGASVAHDQTRANLVCLATGITVRESMRAAQELVSYGIRMIVVDCYTIQPLPVDFLRAVIQRAQGRVLVVEDHYRAGGLGEAALSACAADIVRAEHAAIPCIPPQGSGVELRAWAGIDAVGIMERARAMVG